tara:strand:+ start:3080 stop:3562 length:483 start_codon:yes stop_codon:yes gene_type:complete
MSNLYVDNIVEKTTGAGVHIPGHVIQYQQRVFDLAGFQTTSGSMVAVSNVYVDITPKFSNSLIRFQTQILGKNASSTGYARFDVVDSSNSNTRFNPNAYAEGAFYESTGWDTAVIHCLNTANTTNTMRLQLRVLVGSTGTVNLAWSGSDSRHVEVWEIAQ